MNIRLSTVDDYEQIAAIHNIMIPDFHMTADKFVEEDKMRPAKIEYCRWVAEVDKKVVSHAFYTQLLSLYHPNKFVIGAYVLPEYQNKGIGTALCEVVTSSLEQFDPIYYHVFARENLPRGIEFLTKRDFVEIFRERVSHLDVPAFDSTRYVDLENKLSDCGVMFKKLSELDNDPEYKHRLYELDWELFNDIPELNEPPVKPSFDEWLKSSLNHAELRQDAYHVAVKDGEYVGYSYLWGGSKTGLIHNGMTGVKRQHRRKGIALMLKVLSVKYAKEHGFSILWTSNSVTNPAILAVNDRLGYVKQYETVEMMKRFRDG